MQRRSGGGPSGGGSARRVRPAAAGGWLALVPLEPGPRYGLITKPSGVPAAERKSMPAAPANLAFPVPPPRPPDGAEEEEAARRVRQVVIPVIVLGPCGEQLSVAFDDGYLEQQAAAEKLTAAEGCGCAEGQPPAGQAACGSAAGSVAGGSDGSADSSAAAQAAEPQTDAQPAAEPAPTPPASLSPSSSGPDAEAGPPSLVRRVTCPATCSVLSVADVAGLHCAEDGR